MATTRKGAEKVARIMEAASRIFAHNGFRKTTLEEIAEAASMGKATLYHYFPQGKEQIFGAVVQHVVDDLFKRIVQVINGPGTVAERLNNYLRLRVSAYHEQTALFGTSEETMGELYPLAETELARHLAQELALLVGLVTSGVRSGEFRAVNAALVARIIQTGLKSLSSDAPFDISTEERMRETEEFLELMMRGLLAHQAG